ncbi:MAG: hypothetical protein K2K57_07520 [Oscillospiraceae bacterium]|nr:hypothetical protein [Oscillospiraceae bacterium]
MSAVADNREYGKKVIRSLSKNFKNISLPVSAFIYKRCLNCAVGIAEQFRGSAVHDRKLFEQKGLRYFLPIDFQGSIKELLIKGFLSAKSPFYGQQIFKLRKSFNQRFLRKIKNRLKFAEIP